MLYVKFQASEPGCSEEEEDFLIFFYVFLRFRSGPPRTRAILETGTLI